MYLAVTKVVVSAVICFLRHNKMLPIYYVSHVLVGDETLYSPLEKHIFNLFISARELKQYLQVYPELC